MWFWKSHLRAMKLTFFFYSFIGFLAFKAMGNPNEPENSDGNVKIGTTLDNGEDQFKDIVFLNW